MLAREGGIISQTAGASQPFPRQPGSSSPWGLGSNILVSVAPVKVWASFMVSDAEVMTRVESREVMGPHPGRWLGDASGLTAGPCPLQPETRTPPLVTLAHGSPGLSRKISRDPILRAVPSTSAITRLFWNFEVRGHRCPYGLGEAGDWMRGPLRVTTAGEE